MRNPSGATLPINRALLSSALLHRVLVAGLCLWATSCAPSFRLVHLGSSYFEHCYAADFEALVPVNQKEACWTAWLMHYTRHQPGHRVDYAMRRIETLQMGDSTLPGESQNYKSGNHTFGSDPIGNGASAGHGLPEDQRMHGDEAEAMPSKGDGRGCEPVCASYEQRCLGNCDGSPRCADTCALKAQHCLGACS